jgi:hypothetical protein
MNNVIYINKNGERRKKPPEETPHFKPKSVVNGNGISPQNGIPVRPILETEVKKSAKKKESI